MKKNKPVFKVLIDDWNRDTKIDYRNWFEFGQWQVIKRKLKEAKTKLLKVKDADHDKIDKVVKTLIWDDKFKWTKGNFVKECINKILDRECLYYFWAKSEYEIVLTHWISNGVEHKIDIYYQLKANWDLFADIVFKEIGLE